MDMGKKITDLGEGSAIPGESSYAVAMGDGTGVKQVKHKTLVKQLLKDMEMPYDETLAMLTGTEADEDGEENGKQKIPNLKAISDWIMSRIVNNLLATEEGFFMDARVGPVLDQRITANADAITQINSDLATSGLKDGNIVRNVYIQSNEYLHNQGWGNDLNNARKVGSYHCSDNQSNPVLNAPLESGWGTVHVLANTERVIQFFTYWNVHAGEIFVRTYNGKSGWNPWKKLVTEEID